MQIRSTQIGLKGGPKKAPKDEQQTPKTPKEIAQDLGFDDIDNYTGPADGKSHPHHREILRPLTKALVALEHRVELEGMEKMPTEGPQIYCPSHPSFWDPAIAATLFDRDVRFIANYQFFDGVRGKLMTAMGAFPVDLERGSATSVKHSLEIVKQGKGFVIFPEGKISDDPNKVDPLKKGVGMIATRAGAETITPIGIHYKPNDKFRAGERAVGALAAAAVGAASVVAAASPNPVVRVLAGAVGGGLTGLVAGGAHGRKNTVLEKQYNTLPRFFNGVKGGAIGAAAGAVIGGAVAGMVPGGGYLTAGAGALGTLGLAEAWRNRDVVSVVVGDPIAVAPYKEQYKKREAGDKLAADVHTALGRIKAEQSGVPYDEDGPKLRD